MADPDNIEERIGDRVRAVRKELELRQEDVARRADMSSETVSRIERGVQGVTFPNVARIADALDVPFADLCDLEVATDELVSTAKNERVRQLLEEASAEQIELLMDMAETIIDWSREQGSDEDRD